MALDTYTALKTSVAGWLRRSDLAALIPDFVSLAEAQMRRRLRVRPMDKIATSTVAAEYSQAPVDFITPVSYFLTAGQGVELKLVSQDFIDRRVAACPTIGQPVYYAIVGSQFRYYPTPDTSYTAKLTYRSLFAPLSDANASNWILAEHPDAYLYGALLQTAPYLKSDDRINTWTALFATALDDIEKHYRTTNETPLRADDAFLQRRSDRTDGFRR